MIALSLNHGFLFFAQAIVFGLLAFFLWMFYRGFGRQYVKLWTTALVALSIKYGATAIQTGYYLGDITSFNNVLLSWISQLSSYHFWLLFSLGVYSAKDDYTISKSTVTLWLGGAFTIATLATFFYAFDINSVFNRFYLRVSLHDFMVGCLLFVVSAFLFLSKRHHFSSRILMITSAIIGVRYILYSFSSILFPTADWLRIISDALIYTDAGSFSIIGFTMLIWMQGAERYSAVSAMKRAKYLGKHDSLTGIMNRTEAMEQLSIEMGKKHKKDHQLCVMLIDLKRFKFINDTYGLKTGDAILGEIAGRLTNSILMPLVIGRLSGDSFLFTIEIEEPLQINDAANHLHQLIERPFFHDGQEITTSCSIGYCLYPEHGDQAEDLLQKANLALHQAESTHSPTLQFESTMQVKGRELMKMEKEIRQALEKDEFILHYQPQLNLFTNRLEGVEALVRWQHPEKGLVPPGQFLPHIDALGLNSDLDAYVLNKSCQAIANWHQIYKRRVTIAVNLSAMEFQDPKLVTKIQSLLFKYDVPPKCLDLEITENVVMTDIKKAMNTIVTLQNMGINVSIDDFGTGYSSLAYLRELPIDKIKIDRSFIQEVATNDSDLTIVKSMIDLSHGLGKRVLAEGVENAEQLNLLRNIGCDAVQGFYVARPQPEETLAKYLKRK